MKLSVVGRATRLPMVPESRGPSAGETLAPLRFQAYVLLISVQRCPSVVEFPVLQKIISGGQTGADRSALDFAITHGLPHGGWCPRGRLAEDGPISARYQLTETPTSDYAERTAWNVRDSDATVIFSTATTLTGGSQYTAELARQYHKPFLHLSRDREGNSAAGKLLNFLAAYAIEVLNVAGPRASEDPDVAAFVQETLLRGLQAAGL